MAKKKTKDKWFEKKLQNHLKNPVTYPDPRIIFSGYKTLAQERGDHKKRLCKMGSEDAEDWLRDKTKEQKINKLKIVKNYKSSFYIGFKNTLRKSITNG